NSINSIPIPIPIPIPTPTPIYQAHQTETVWLPPPKALGEEARWGFPAKLRQKVKARQSPVTRAKRSGADLRPPTS
ncbi:MAG TPA: hypothetical protein DEW46_14055, partial [Verrucomicrobia bacterium]|nr:hypothetical protein [Verrucomicrobiota bacterium]